VRVVGRRYVDGRCCPTVSLRCHDQAPVISARGLGDSGCSTADSSHRRNTVVKVVNRSRVQRMVVRASSVTVVQVWQAQVWVAAARVRMLP